jgi:hypothetical protein
MVVCELNLTRFLDLTEYRPLASTQKITLPTNTKDKYIEEKKKKCESIINQKQSQ